MLIYKHRGKPMELRMLEALARRMRFSHLDTLHFLNDQSGFGAEAELDVLLSDSGFKGLVLNDLSFSDNGSWQIDSLLLTGNQMLLYDMKNYAGNHYFREGQFHNERKEINNPLVKQERHKSLLRQLTTRLGYSYPLEAHVVFMNPSFYLYHAPEDLPILFRQQVPKHLEKLGQMGSYISTHQEILAKSLIRLHKPNLFEPSLPKYTFATLKKGIPCEICTSFSLVEKGHSCICRDCGHQEKKFKAILRNVAEFQLLFPKEKLTTATIYEWCRIIQSPRSIRYVLQVYLHGQGAKKGKFYETIADNDNFRH